MIREFKENPSAEALSWLFEMEMLNNPTVLNSVVLNVFKLTKGIVDAEFVVDMNDKKLLVYLELNFWHKHFKKAQVQAQVLDMLDTVIPSFKKRVVYDKEILEKAINIINNKRKQELRITVSNGKKNINKPSLETTGVSQVEHRETISS
jgi:hypothetical protein